MRIRDLGMVAIIIVLLTVYYETYQKAPKVGMGQVISVETQS